MEKTILKEHLKYLDNETIRLQEEFHAVESAISKTRIAGEIEGINFSKVWIKKEIELLS